MRVVCRHGFFSYFPEAAGEIVGFTGFYGLTLNREEDYYTFPALKGLPRYSIVGKTYGGLPATVTYEGRRPWDVMRENGFVYSLATSKLVPKASITINVNMPLVDDGFFICQAPFLQPGSRDASGQQILSFDGGYDAWLQELRIAEYKYV